MVIRDRVFRSYVSTYLEAIEVTRYRELADLQSPPFATLANGGAGTAYALWRLGRTRRAQAWMKAVRSDRTRAAFRAPTSEHWTPRSSYMFGRAGQSWVQARIGGSQRRAAIADYVAAARARPRLAEFASGEAGHLRSLEKRVRARMEAAWHPQDAMRFAHGWSGVLYALLAYHQWRNEPAPEWLVSALIALVSVWSPTDAGMGLASSWCNGAAGALLFWAKAYRCTSERRFLEAARIAAQTALGCTGQSPTLCCGDAGVAYGLLALDLVDPDQRWRVQARELAAAAIRDSRMKWPNGLFQGHPGLVCLALDCIAERAGGFPAIEA